MTTLLRPHRTPLVAPVAPPPWDVRLMDGIATLLYAAVALLALGAAAAWLWRAPLLPIRVIEIEGEMVRTSVPALRANAAPRLAGNFFSVDLQRCREVFEAVPWVRRAVVRRVWPDRLVVRLEEHRAAALWQGADEEGEPERLVNEQGEVFQANVGDVQDEPLPVLQGPEGQAAGMLSLALRLRPLLARLDLPLEQLQLGARGSWRAELGDGATIELGRGSADEVLARAERFTATYADAAGRWQAPLQHADLRHSDGYAIRLRGLTVATAAAAPGPGATARTP